MTLSGVEWLSKIFTDTKRRAVSLRQLSFLLRYLKRNTHADKMIKTIHVHFGCDPADIRIWINPVIRIWIPDQILALVNFVLCGCFCALHCDYTSWLSTRTPVNKPSHRCWLQVPVPIRPSPNDVGSTIPWLSAVTTFNATAGVDVEGEAMAERRRAILLCFVLLSNSSGACSVDAGAWPGV